MDDKPSTPRKPRIHSLWQEFRELTLPSSSYSSPAVDRLHSPPSPLHFLRRFISQNKPCLITNSISHFPALSLWSSPSYLSSALSSSSVSVQLTPTGLADSPTLLPDGGGLCFASPHALRLPFPDALELIVSGRRDRGLVAYAQAQDDCFRKDGGGFDAIRIDVDDEIPWMSEAMGSFPDAVNIWIGNGESATWFHKDHYENLYAVICGEKRFTLIPPCEFHRMYVREYPAAEYVYSEDTGDFELRLEEPKRQVPWCSVDPYPSPEDLERMKREFPLYFNGPKPIEVTVKAGEMLYLPSMWFHHVQQNGDERGGLAVAVNYWYDMQFDIKYAYFNFLQSIQVEQESEELLSAD
ncbi:hypothetical protein MLD38_039737 [Melastoma candidum]|uniref:Uncharacterized protein n=1 Tax=Melastoma candidum TaxID=119954 RepID=A0ACB9L3R3_9MYRT|nr:hypothetical protein MLD38_039737 [Melastoma candidum]